MLKFKSRYAARIAIIIMLFLATGNGISALCREITVVDKLGRNVRVQVPVKRGVLLTTYELVPALGIWDGICASGKWANNNDIMKACGKNTGGLPSVGSGADVNMEVMMKLRPDAVVSWTFRPEQLKFMEERGLTVISIYPDSLNELIDVIRMHGRIFDKEKRAEFCIARMNEIFSLIKKRSLKIRPAERQKVLYLGSRPTGVSGKSGMTNDIIELIGGINSAAEIGERNADVSLEKIIRWNPDIIFIWGNAIYSADDIKNNPQWRHINAVKNGRVYKSPDWSNWSPRIAPVALWMARKTYPELYKDINFSSYVEPFFIKIFGLSYRKVKPVEE